MNNSTLALIYVTCVISALPCGFAFAGFNQAGLILEKQLNLSPTQMALITSAGVVGPAFGSLSAARFMVLGRKWVALFASALVALSTVPMMFPYVFTFVIGRFLLGFGTGLAICACSTWMAETVPTNQIGIVGTSVNFGCNLGLLMSQLVQGFSLPSIDSEEALTTDSYRVGFLAPAFIALTSFLLWQFYIREESLHYLIDTKQIERAEALHSRFFPSAPADTIKTLA